jgi:signal transduction histidine kinase
MLRPIRTYWFYIFIVAACLLVAGVTAFTTGMAADRQNRFLLVAQLKVVENETNAAYLEMSGKLSTEANWQTAYDNVVKRWNRKWVEKEYDHYLDSIGIHHAAIFGPHGELRFLGAGNVPWQPREASVAAAGGVRELLKAVQSTWPQSLPQQKSGIVVIDGKPCFAVASAITPDEAAEAASDPALRYTLMYFKPVTAGTYASLSAVLDTRGIAIHTGIDAVPEAIMFPLYDAAGRMRAHIGWTPYEPGTRVLRVLFPVLLFMLLLLALVLTQGAMRWQRMQSKMLDNAARAKAMEEEVRIKSAFIGNISHELRTPLNAILGFAEMLKMHIFGPLGDSHNDEYVENIFDGGRKLLALVNDLIEISRIESGDKKVECETIDAVPCLYAACEEVRPLAEAKGVILAVKGGATDVWCLGSTQNLQQVVRRTLENAVAVSVKDQTVTVYWQRTGKDVVIAVNDKSSPLPKELLVRVNGRLSLYGHDHLLANKSHLGINFNIAQGLLILMGGNVMVESGPDIGNTVFLRLPIVAAPRRSTVDCAA